MRPHVLMLAVGLSLTIGCSVEPPLPLERDPQHVDVPLPPEQRVLMHVAVAPVRAALPDWGWRDFPATVAAVDSADVAAVSTKVAPAAPPRRAQGTRPVAPLTLEDREYAWRPPLRGRRLQRRLGQVFTWAIAGEDRVHLLDPATPAVELCARAEDAGADLLLHMELVDERVAWVERDGLWWWSNFLLFYGPGIYPVVLISDEVYDVGIVARVSLVHPRSGYRLLSHAFLAVHRQSLNDPQRGWSLTGLFFLYPYTLDASDYRNVLEALEPHALKSLELQIARWLREQLPGRLREPPVRRLIELGDPARARTYALVVGCDGPAAGEGDAPPPLAFAEKDAHALGQHLLETGTVASPRHLTVLTGGKAHRRGVLAALDRLADRTLGNDRLLVFYSGYGTTDADGESGLVLPGGVLPLREVRQRLERLHPHTQVVFALDASFTRGGKAYPGGALPEAKGYLGPLWEGRPAWHVLAAGGPKQTAWESRTEAHGLLTAALLRAAPGDVDGDGVLTTVELEALLREGLSDRAKRETGYQQTPQLIGAPTPADVLRVPAQDE